VFFAFSVSAQIKGDEVSLSTNPQNPGPNTSVTTNLSSFSVDLDKTLISWSINGQVLLQGVGQKNFSFKTGDSGTQTVVGVKIDATDGSTANKQLILNSANVDLVWEAVDSYVPPFYKGKALVSQEGTVKVVALLNSSKSSGASYNWKLDGKGSQMFSGYGKSAYFFKKSYLDKTNKVSVSISNLLNESIGSASLEIGNSNPKILFYKKDPYLGTIWEKSLSDYFTIDPSGETIVVEPYFISPKNINSSDLKLSWELGGSNITTPSTKNELSIKPQTNGGNSKIKVTAENIKSMFLNISKEINVKF
jgi:hypothetical protein